MDLYNPPDDVREAPAYKQLSREVYQPVRWRQVWITLIGVTLIVLALNGLAYLYLTRDRVNLGAFIASEKWRILNNLQTPVDWVVLGDSSANQGVVPDEIESCLGGSAVNLATIADWTLLNDAWMLENYLSRFDAPDGVIIVHVYNIYPRSLRPEVVSQAALPWRFWAQYSPAPGFTAGDEANILLEKFFPLYYRNETLLQAVKQVVSTRGSFLSQPNPINAQGYMASDKADPTTVERDARNQINFVNANAFQVSSANQAAIDRIIELAEQYSFDVYFGNSPMYEVLYEDPAFQQYLTRVQDWLRETTSRSTRTHYLPSVSTFPATEMENADHIIDTAARQFTETLCSDVRAVGNA